MNQDVFIEKIVKRKWGSKEMAISLGGTFLAVVLIVVFLLLSVFIGQQILFYLLTIAAFAIGYLAYRLLTGMRYEYEYSVTNDELTIDKIIARRKRKRMYNGSCKQFTLMAPVNSDEYNQSLKQNPKMLDYRSGEDPKAGWFILTRKDNLDTMICFEPDERFINAFRRFNPRVIKKV